MSGICAIFQCNGAPTGQHELAPVLAALERRGPDRSNLSAAGPVALGHALLATTPEALAEPMPFTHLPTGCMISADIRLDNRDDLLAALGPGAAAGAIGDGQLVLLAYLAWGTACLDYLRGDFAFAIWDPRRRQMFCARDQIGMRPLVYHHAPGKLFAMASEPHALLRHEAIPHRLNEGRLADYFENLEAFDLTSTFFLDLYRLPPAHAMMVTADQLKIWRYWQLAAQPALKLADDREFAEAFREVFSRAVAMRLRSPGPVAAMLSGGMDSGAVAAMAAHLLKQAGRPALQTFSAVSSDPKCIETAAITSAQGMDHIAPSSLTLDDLDGMRQELMRLSLAASEPFDTNMTLLRMIYVAAQHAGHKVVLDGGGGDMTLAPVHNMVWWHLNHGRPLRAWREACGHERFWGPQPGAAENFARALGRVIMPFPLRAARRGLLERLHPASPPSTLLSPEFAARIDLDGRRSTNAAHIAPYALGSADSHVLRLPHPYLTSGRERYDRIASATAIEPRDPFTDVALLEFCARLPPEQFQHDGWPKIILRRANDGLLPDDVRWRLGKEHLGGLFHDALWRAEIQSLAKSDLAILNPYISDDVITKALESGRNGFVWDSAVARLLSLRYAAAWLINIATMAR